MSKYLLMSVKVIAKMVTNCDDKIIASNKKQIIAFYYFILRQISRKKPWMLVKLKLVKG